MNKNGNASPYIRVVVLKNGPNADVKENGVQVVQTQAGKDQESNLVVLKQKTSTSRSMAVSKDNTSCNSVSSQTRGDINILKCIDLPEVGEAKFNQEMANGDTAENNPGNVALVSNKCETECTENKAVIDKTPQRIDARYFRDDSFVCKKEASPLENCAVSAYICEANVRKEHYLNDDKTHIEKRVEIGQSLNEVPDIARLLQLTATSIAATKFTTGYSDDLKDETYYNQALLTKEENGNTKAGIRPYENGPKVFSCLGSRPVYPHKDMLEQMKKTISESFLRQVMQQKKDAEEQKMAQLLPGTDVEYRTPGANFRNKNGRVKRPMNAFMVWAREYRGRLAAAMPRATNSEISITLGRVWASMPPHEKQAYYDIAEKIKRKHRQDFPNWVYKPSFQRREEVPMPRPENSWARVIVDPSGSNKTITVTSQGAPATLETTTSVPNTFIPSDNTKQVLVGKSGPQIGSHQQGTLDTIAKPVAQVERIPVILQRVTLKTNAESSTSTSYVSSYTKGLLANKIAISNHSATQPSTVGITAHARVSAAISSRPEIAVVPQRQDVYLTPSLQKNLAMMSLMTSSIRTTHAQTLPAQIKLGDQQLHLLNKGARPGPLTTGGTPYRHLQSVQQQIIPGPIIPIYQSHISPVVKALAFPPTALKSADVKPGLYGNAKPAVKSSVEVNADLKSTRSDETVLKNTEDNHLDSLIREARACLNETYNSGERNVSPRANVPHKCFKVQTKFSSEESGQIPEVDDVESCWPFPFSENPDDWALTTRAHEDIYLEMRDPYDPFLVDDDDDFADRFPGGLHLDVDSWNRYLESDEDEGDFLAMLQTSKKAPDISISPLPLKETLRRFLNAVVESSDSGDVITGDLILEVVT